MRQQILYQRQDVLVWRGAGVDDIGGALEPFVMRGVPQHGVVLFEQRDHFLARRRGVAADHVADVALQQPGRERGVLRKVTAGIEDGRFKANAERRGIDFVGGENGAIQHRARDQFVRTGRGKQIAHLKILKRHQLGPTQQTWQSRPRRNCAVRRVLQIGWRRFGHLCPAPVLKARPRAPTCQEQIHSGRFISRKSIRNDPGPTFCKHHVQIVSVMRSRKWQRCRCPRSQASISRLPCSAASSANSNRLGQRTVDNQIGAGDATGHGTCDKHHTGRDFLWRSHPRRRIQ
jgi:hypothetical protein